MENPSAQVPLVSIPGQTLPASQADAASLAMLAVQGKRRGRHPKDCPCDKCATNRSQGSKSPSAISERTLTEAEKKLATETCIAFTHVADTLALWKFRQHIGVLPENQQQAILSKIPMSESLRRGIGETGAIVAEKHGVVKSLPELALCSYIAAYVTSLGMLAMDVRKYTMEYAKLKAESEKDTGDRAKRERKE